MSKWEMSFLVEPNALYSMPAAQVLKELRDVEQNPLKGGYNWRGAMWVSSMQFRAHPGLIWLICFDVSCVNCSAQQPDFRYHDDFNFLMHWAGYVGICHSRKCFDYLMEMNSVFSRFDSALAEADKEKMQGGDEIPFVGDYKLFYKKVLFLASESTFWSVKCDEIFYKYRLELSREDAS